MKTYFVDTETCGFHGVPVTIQYAIDDGDINLYHIWTKPIWVTLKLIESMVDNLVVCHNMRFDWFHLSKIYNMLDQINVLNRSSCPADFSFDYWAKLEYQARFGKCLKPAAAVDTMLLASKSESQSSLMGAKPVWIRRVPVGLSGPLLQLLEDKTDLPWILFAKRSQPDSPKWSVSDCRDADGEFDPRFKDLKLSFAPSKSLKHLAAYLCDHNVKSKFEEVAFATKPNEEGFAPFAELVSSKERDWLYDGKPTWPSILEQHIEHWATDKDAIQYALDDIVMLRKLYEYFGSPKNDDDAMVACQVASVRLRGFSVNIEGVREQLDKSAKIVSTAQLNVGSPKQVLNYVSDALDSMEQFLLADGCDQKVIDVIKNDFTIAELEECPCLDEDDDQSTTKVDGICQRCEGRGSVGPTGICSKCEGHGCPLCDSTGLSEDREMPVVKRVRHIELIRRHKKRVELFDKLILSKRAYPDFNVIGTKSGRMSGAGGLNFQGIDNSHVVRSLFTLSDEETILSAGDYSSQELAIAATTMQDEDLMRDLKSGKSLHGLFAAELFETTYEDIMSHKKEDNSRYDRGKSAVFLTLYGGTFETLALNCGVTTKQAERALNRMVQKYVQMGSTRKAITDRFSSIHQGGDGKIEYQEVENPFIESVFGFKRYFHTEYKIQKMLWDIVRDLPEKWQSLTLKVQRDRKNLQRVQTICGAVSSALYGACFSIQNKIIRASNNHIIQSTGRTLTVGMQSAVWDIQPQGIHPFKLTLMSIHDELAVVSARELVGEIENRIEEKVEEQCEVVPLTRIEWFSDNPSWAEKGSGKDGKTIGWQEE